MTRKVQENDAKGGQVTDTVTSTPLAPTPQARGGQAVKATGGACKGNSRAVTTGSRRSRTPRGGPSHRDRFDTQARRWTLETFRGRKYDVDDPMRGILSDLESCIRRAKFTLDRRGWHRADGEEKVAATSYHALTARKEVLLRGLEQRYCPDVQAKADESQFVHICHFSNGKVVGTSPSRDGKSQETMIEEAELEMAVYNLSGGGLPTDASHCDAFWAGRLWSGEAQGMKIARFDAEPPVDSRRPAVQPTQADDDDVSIQIETSTPEPQDAHVPVLDPDPAPVEEPAPLLTVPGGQEYLASRRFVLDRDMGRRRR